MIDILNKYFSSYHLDKNMIFKAYNLKDYHSIFNNQTKDDNKIKVYIKCFITKTQMQIPTRGKNCSHLECCEYENYLIYVFLKSKCIICGKDVTPSEVIVDSYLKKIFDIAISQNSSTYEDSFYIEINKSSPDDFIWNQVHNNLSTEIFSNKAEFCLYSFVKNDKSIEKGDDTSIFESVCNQIRNYFKTNLEDDFDIKSKEIDYRNVIHGLKKNMELLNLSEIIFILFYVPERNLNILIDNKTIEKRFIYIVIVKTEDNYDEVEKHILESESISESKNKFNVIGKSDIKLIPITKEKYSFDREKINIIIHHYKDERDYITKTKRFIYEYINYLKYSY